MKLLLPPQNVPLSDMIPHDAQILLGKNCHGYRNVLLGICKLDQPTEIFGSNLKKDTLSICFNLGLHTSLHPPNPSQSYLQN